MQRTNKWKILVTYSDDSEQWGSLAGTTQTLWFPTQQAALEAAQGFRLLGCNA